METITAAVKKIVYRNGESWGVARLEDGTTITGILPADMRDGSPCLWRFIGEWQDHPKFGRQLKIASAVRDLPTSGSAIADYLADIATDIGPKRARRIVEAFGDQALEIVKQYPDRLAAVISGITPARAAEISAQVRGAETDEELTLAILEYLGPDGTQSLVRRVKDRWGLDAPGIMARHPYRLAELDRVGFATADRIALAHGVIRSAPARIMAGVTHVLGDVAQSDGHTCLPVLTLADETAELLGVEDEAVYDQIERLVDAHEIIVEDDHAYSAQVFLAESLLADRLASLARSAPRVMPTATESPAGLYEDQAHAWSVLTQSTVGILTGAPGTGKTHTIRTILDAFDVVGRVALCAPTGKAAKRMSELAGVPASTIHRLLRPVMTRQGFLFTRGVGKCPACSGDGERKDSPCSYCEGTGEKQPLDADLVIVDETSMVDLRLACSLVEALTKGTRVLFVGDSYQLPSVGAGSVLADVMAAMPHVELTEIKRQAAGSRIVVACHQIKNGRVPDLSNGKETDLAFVAAETPEECAATIADLVFRRLPRAYGYDPLEDIQVITGLRKNTLLGADQLNTSLQRAFGKIPESGIFARGDKVIQLRNESLIPIIAGDECWVVNGDIGYVTDFAERNRVRCAVVQFSSPDRLLYAPVQGGDCNLTLAYAVTVHKFQGSQAPAVVVPINRCLGALVPQRTWLYTALSRAQRLCVVVGQRSEFAKIVERDQVRKRVTRLAGKIVQSLQMA